MGRYLLKKNILFNLKFKSLKFDGWIGSNLNVDLRLILFISVFVFNKFSKLIVLFSEE